MAVRYEVIASKQVIQAIEDSPNPNFRKKALDYRDWYLKQSWVVPRSTHLKSGHKIPHAHVFVPGDFQVDGKLFLRKLGVSDQSFVIFAGDLTVESLKQAVHATVFVAGTLTVSGVADCDVSDSMFVQCGPIRANEIRGGSHGSLSAYDPDIEIHTLRGFAGNYTGQEVKVKNKI